MRKLPVEDLRPGMVVGNNVLTDRSVILLRPDVSLTQRQIDRLHEYGALAIYVHDNDISDEIVIRDTLDLQTRSHATARLNSLYHFVAEREEQWRRDAAPVSEIVRRADDSSEVISDVLKTVEEIMNDVLVGDLLLTMGALKSVDGYSYQHSIDVAVAGALLARKLWLPESEIRDVVAGSLVLDIGNVALPQELRDHEGGLSVDEFEQYKRHTTDGYELLKRLGWEDVLPRHIAYQHHERQDGSGYPRGLRGNNRVLRSAAAERDGRRILRIAEVASIADVFDALVSDRPYRNALSLGSAVQTLRAMAGAELNAEMVQAFLTLVPTYPRGCMWSCVGGRFAVSKAWWWTRTAVKRTVPRCGSTATARARRPTSWSGPWNTGISTSGRWKSRKRRLRRASRRPAVAVLPRCSGTRRRPALGRADQVTPADAVRPLAPIPSARRSGASRRGRFPPSWRAATV